MWLTQGDVDRSRAQSPNFPCILSLSFSLPNSGFVTVLLGDRRRTRERPGAFSLGIAILKRKVTGNPFSLVWT